MGSHEFSPESHWMIDAMIALYFFSPSLKIEGERVVAWMKGMEEKVTPGGSGCQTAVRSWEVTWHYELTELEKGYGTGEMSE